MFTRRQIVRAGAIVALCFAQRSGSAVAARPPGAAAAPSGFAMLSFFAGPGTAERNVYGDLAVLSRSGRTLTVALRPGRAAAALPRGVDTVVLLVADGDAPVPPR